MEVIIVTGVPGTGKTTIAKEISKEKNYLYIDVNKLIKKEKLYVGYDKKRACQIVDVNKLCKRLDEVIEKHSKEKGIIIDSHLSHYLSNKKVDLCIVTKCSLKELKRRLKERKYSGQKIRENLDAEIFDTCRIEALEAGHKVKVVWTDRDYGLEKIYK
ncbi:adenylate kinase family protein [Candidatus Woesearchaeota archaeon]|nr:adenylate kinase family protein [Candidatus Woesearchaeota archaeon]